MKNTKAIEQAKNAAQAMKSNRAVVFLVDENDQVITASWGADTQLCKEAAGWCDKIHDFVMDGGLS